MSGPLPSPSWTTRAWQASLVLLMTAGVARLVWWLLEPLLPVLVVVAVLVFIIGISMRGRL